MRLKKAMGAVLAVAMALSLVPTVEARASIFDEMSNATAVTYGQNVSGTIDSADDADWYKFTTTDYAANYSISVSNLSEVNSLMANRLGYRLYDDAGKCLTEEQYTMQDGETLNYKLEPKTVYSIKLYYYPESYCYFASEFEYAIKVSCEQEDPDSQTTATEINLNQSYTGQIFTSSDEDWFEFTASQYNMIYSFQASNISGEGGKLGYRVYDADKNRIFSNSLENTKNDTSELTLNPGKKYYIQFFSNGGYYTPYNYSFKLNAADISTLDIPNANVSPLTKGFTVSWDAVKYAAGYEVRYSTGADMSGAATVALGTTSQSVTGMEENTVYFVQVRAYATLSTGATLYSDWSVAKTVTTDIESLGTPTLSVSSASAGVNATWSDVKNAAGYEVRYGTNANMGDAKTIKVGPTAQSITDLKEKTLYYVQVRAYAKLSTGDTLYSEWSEIKSAATDVSSLNAPSVSVSPLVKGLNVSWNTVTNADGYEILYSTKDDMSAAKTVAVTSTSKKITGLTENKVYYVQVRAYANLSTGEKLYSGWSYKKSVTTDISSLKTATVKASAASKAFNVKWGKVKNAAGYEIRYSTKKNMKGSKKVTTTLNKLKITGLKGKKTYYVQVRAYAKRSTGKTVYSKWSTVKKVKTKK